MDIPINEILIEKHQLLADIDDELIPVFFDSRKNEAIIKETNQKVCEKYFLSDILPVLDDILVLYITQYYSFQEHGWDLGDFKKETLRGLYKSDPRIKAILDIFDNNRDIIISLLVLSGGHIMEEYIANLGYRVSLAVLKYDQYFRIIQPKECTDSYIIIEKIIDLSCLDCTELFVDGKLYKTFKRCNWDESGSLSTCFQYIKENSKLLGIIK